MSNYSQTIMVVYGDDSAIAPNTLEGLHWIAEANRIWQDFSIAQWDAHAPRLSAIGGHWS